MFAESSYSAGLWSRTALRLIEGMRCDMKVLFALGALFGAMFGRVVYLYLEARAAYRRRARRPPSVPVPFADTAPSPTMATRVL